VNSISHPGAVAWIVSQRVSLVRIFQRLELARESLGREAASSRKSSAQLTLFGPDSFSSKTPRESGPEAGTSSLGNSWRVDIPGETDELPRLMSEPLIIGNGGFAWLPTLTVCGNWNRKGASANSGDGLATALRRLPTILATDADHGGPNARDSKGRFSLPGALFNLLPTLTASELAGGRTVPEGTTLQGKTPEGRKVQVGLKTALKMLPTLTQSDGSGGPGTSPNRTGGMNLRTAITMLPTICATDWKGPYSAEGYQRQTETRSKPLRDTLVHSTGHRLTPAFAEWWMGWPLRWTATRREKESKRVATGRSRSRLPRLG
jgi:hypothetical protein